MIIDISHHQAPSQIDYKKLCAQLDMAIIRVQYGSRVIDKHYKTHIAEMKKYNVPFGVYAWVRGINENDMKVEAQDFYNRSKAQEPLFYVLDVEEKSMSDMRAGINAYIEKLRSLTDKKIGIYIGHHLYKDFNLNLTKADFVWIPHYGVNNGLPNSKPIFPCDLHQFTSVGRLEGYNGNLDLNRLMNGRTIEFFTGEAKEELDVIKISLHGKEIEVEGICKNNINYIPVRFMESLGYKIDWKEKTILIDYNNDALV
ncbi:GH25 family lysozyme [Tissierella sp. Yu-01]|uniref:GH25 family lysozyme n=1 Tax=Tissierella sp. Yu-01 TaxID=3035694 RepID=UPI00240D3FC3|nr:GH25 family lysozyme [Tissierella sp. Yu-01]WFA10320.1 GH25 family lysozyme [Tissierella sp. Yu-01]